MGNVAKQNAYNECLNKNYFPYIAASGTPEDQTAQDIMYAC